MANPESRRNNNPKCPPRLSVEFTIDEASAKEIAANARVIPLFEKGMFEHAYKKHYSLMRNKNLECEWTKYKKNLETKVLAPFRFPDQRDLHFYKSTIRFIPSETEFKRASFRKTLKPGPGVDYGGQMPIPQELIMKRNFNKDKKEEKVRKKRNRPKTAKGSATTSSKDENKDKEKKVKDSLQPKA